MGLTWRYFDMSVQAEMIRTIRKSQTFACTIQVDLNKAMKRSKNASLPRPKALFIICASASPNQATEFTLWVYQVKPQGPSQDRVGPKRLK